MVKNISDEPLRKIVKLYFQNGSIHGISNFIRTKQILIKALWLAILIISAVYCCYSIKKIILNYFEFECVSNMVEEFYLPIDFPSVTICDTDRNLKIADLISSCFYNTFQCSSEDFYEQIEKCYSFNVGRDSDGNHSKIRKSYGPDFLELEIFTQTMVPFKGLDIIIHNHKYIPNFDFLSNQLFTIPSGNYF